MRFSKKIFISVFVATFIVGGGIIWTAHYFVSTNTKEKFISQYSVLTKILGDTLTRLDSNTEQLMLNAANVVAARDAERGLLSTEELKAMRSELNVTHIFVTDRNGKFIRSTNEDPSLIPNLFSFSDEYKKLIQGTKKLHATPVIQPNPEPKPYKFLSIANRDRSRIIEVGVRVDFIARTLAEAIGADKNVVSMAMYSPKGTPFGRFAAKDVKFEKDTAIFPINFETVESSDSFKFYSKVTSSHPSCSQCDKSGTSINGEYYYVLESEVSKSELNAMLASTTKASITLLFFNLLLALGISRFLSRRLVRNIEKAVSKVRKIKDHGQLGDRINLKGKDEVAFLTREFDNLLGAMEKSREKVIEAERVQAKVQMARDVAHNIRSPILAIEMMLPTLIGVPERMKRVLKNSVKEIKGLSEKLKQKNESGDFNLERRAITDELLFLPVFLDEIVSQKNLEFGEHGFINIEFRNKGNPSNEFVRVDPLELRSIVSNLVNNAAESFGANSGTIEVSCQDLDSNISVSIADTGSGIPPEYLNRLGREQITFKGSEGRGVGLLHAFRTVESWGGRIKIDSAPGKGTVVAIFLPKFPHLSKFESSSDERLKRDVH
ncbi:MAG: HAMP domain-containing histidine kinase [Bdellovibrionaceae bacterium]|nr:HAMP domain-containing histidine kinase [Pseudobdellovibrionaceae bacterium]